MKISKEKRTEMKEEKICKKMKAYISIARANDADNRKRKRDDKEESISKKTALSRIEVTNTDDIQKLKIEASNRVRARMQAPKLFMKLDGLNAQLDSSESEQRLPLYMSDVQQLLLFAVCSQYAPCHPGWCRLLRTGRLSHTVLLLVENEGIEEFMQNSAFRRTKKLFDFKLEVISPGNYDSSMALEFLWTPMGHRSELYVKQMIQNRQVTEVFKPKEKTSEAKDQFPRTQLLLSADQMVSENYPLPIYNDKFSGFVPTKDEYDPVTDKSPMFAIDCEMVLTVDKRSALARIAVIDEELDVVYHTFVKPKNKIINYLTQYSGITPKLLEGVTTTVEDVQQMIRKYLPKDAILVGQSLNSDLVAMQMMHPYVIDTSVIFNLSGARMKKPGLRVLSKTFLDWEIQQSMDGHCPIEDSKATMRLALLKLSKDIRFGDYILNNGSLDEKKRNRLGTCSIFTRFQDKRKQVALVATNDFMNVYKQDGIISSTVKPKGLCVMVENDWKKILEKTCDFSMENHLTIAHIELRSNLGKVDSESRTKTLTMLDKRIKKIYKSMAKNSLFLVVFGGAVYPDGIQNGKTYSNAVCLATVKTDFSTQF